MVKLEGEIAKAEMNTKTGKVSAVRSNAAFSTHQRTRTARMSLTRLIIVRANLFSGTTRTTAAWMVTCSEDVDLSIPEVLDYREVLIGIFQLAASDSFSGSILERER